MPRVCYLDDRPAFLEVGSALYAVHDIGGGGLRLSQFAAPAVPSPEATAALPALGKTVGGLFRLRSGGSVRLEAVVARVDAGGVLLVPLPARPGAWISDDQLTREATWVQREERERRQSIPAAVVLEEARRHPEPIAAANAFPQTGSLPP